MDAFATYFSFFCLNLWILENMWMYCNRMTRNLVVAVHLEWVGGWFWSVCHHSLFLILKCLPHSLKWIFERLYWNVYDSYKALEAFWQAEKTPKTPHVLVRSWEAGKTRFVCPKVFNWASLSIFTHQGFRVFLCWAFGFVFGVVLITKNFVFSIGVVRGHLGSIPVLGRCSAVLLLGSCRAAQLAHLSF